MEEIKKRVKRMKEIEQENYSKIHKEDLATSYSCIEYGAYMVAYNAVLEQIERIENGRDKA